MNGKMWTANRRIYLNAEGKACFKGDPSAVTLLIREGGQIPLKQAIELGLVEPETEPAKTEATPPAAEPEPEPKAQTKKPTSSRK